MTYEVPPLAKIVANAGSSGLTAASTFSGCGGSGLGLRWAGIEVPFASEFIPAAQDTYRANFPGSHLHTGDIRDLTVDEIIEACDGVPDIFEGSPPCSPFSLSGGRSDLWGEVKSYSDTKQRVDDLFDVWIDLAADLRPRVLLAENVPSLNSGKTVGAFKIIVDRLRDIGYMPNAAVLDARYLGVPQRRQRLIFVAFREDETEAAERFAWPEPVPPVHTLVDACPWVADGVTGDLTPQPGYDTPVARDGSYFDPETGYCIDFRDSALYRFWAACEIGGQPSESRFNLMRCHPDEPVPTITQTNKNPKSAGAKHPHVPRNFTLLETRRLCGFPDDFALTGTYPRRYERLGRAVPPPMYRAVGRSLVEALS